jgi:hypothetical protein
VRWLLLKDLRILRRSPLLLALLVLYPVVVALLVGAALSSGPSKPRVAFANLVPPGEDTIDVGGRRLDASAYAAQLFDAVEPVRVRTRAAAIEKVRSGEVLGALVIPRDAIDRLQGTLGLGGGPQPAVEVYYSAENPLKRRYVQSTIRSTLGEANRALSDQLLRQAAGYLDLVVTGGMLDLPLAGPVDVLGLRRADTIVRATIESLPAGAPERVALEQVSRFARLAADNLDVSGPILASIGTPVRVRERAIAGSGTALDVFGVEVAVIVSLMVVGLLLAAGMLALEREEHAFGRLVRGLVSRTGLVVEKIGLAGLCAWALAAVMLAVLALFVGLSWDRAPLWLAVLAVAAVAFSALGVAVGALCREVRAASLLSFMLALPVAALALVPSGSVGSGLYAVIRVVSGAFPFKPALGALDAAISGGDVALHLLHLALLAAAFTALARLALRRFA